MKAAHSVLGVLLFAGSLSAGEFTPAFTKKPTAAAVAEGVRVEFAVDRPTDVAVTVEDAKGRIVRHLAAAVLGENPPEPLRPNALAQALVWDGKDDFGKPANGAPFKFRVRLGMKPEFDRFLLYNPDASGEISAVAAGPGGTLYVFHKDAMANENMGGHRIKTAGK